MTKQTTETSFPVFPNAIIQGAARKFVDLYSEIRETPESFLWLSFLVYFGNAISPYIRLDCASSEPRIYGVVIGKSGRTRKSAGNNASKDLFQRVLPEGQQIIEGFGSAEGMLTKFGKNNLPCPTTIHLDELNILASKTEISGSAGIAALNKLFEDHVYEAPLAQGGYWVTNAYLSWIAASTLDDFRHMWNNKHANTGFFSRLLLVAGDTDKRIARPLDPDPEKLNRLIEEVKALVATVIRTPQVMGMDREAEEIWARFYENFGDGEEWSRIDTYGLRLMAVQAVLRGEGSVTKANVQQVIDFLQYEVAVRKAVSPIIAENPVAQMEQSIRLFLPEGATMTRRELQRKTNYTRHGIEIFNRALSNMVGNKEIDSQPVGKSFSYTRVRFAEVDGGNGSEAVIGGVFDSGEDTHRPRKPNENAASVQIDSQCHQFSTQPDAGMIM